jgi:hypothetical protein
MWDHSVGRSLERWLLRWVGRLIGLLVHGGILRGNAVGRHSDNHWCWESSLSLLRLFDFANVLLYEAVRVVIFDILFKTNEQTMWCRR